MKVIEKLFYQDAYAVGIRAVDPDLQIVQPSMGEYTMLMANENEWYADSFCFSDNRKTYLFMEIMGRNNKKGTLGVVEYTLDAGFSEVKEILREPFHLSYPNVFKYKSKFYMLPETNEAGQLRLYEADSFPEKWHLKKILFEGRKLVDTSFLQIDERTLLLFSHDITDHVNQLVMFELDLESLVLQMIQKHEKISNERPGGNVIVINGEAFRIIQDCSRQYGEKLKVYQFTIEDSENRRYSERYVGEITAEMVTTNKKVRFSRIHTLTRSGEFEAIDLLYKRFYFTKPIKGIGRIVARIIHGGKV